MIRKNFKDVIQMDASKLSELKKEFPSFFKDKNPTPVEIHTHKQFFFKTQKAVVGGAGDISKAEYRNYLQAPTNEHIQLSFSNTDENGNTDMFSYSVFAPEPKDNFGIKFEYSASSGNIREIGHGTNIYPSEAELLYFLWFYSPIFSNNVIANTDAKYFFFRKEEADKKQVSSIKKQGMVISEMEKLSNSDMQRILKGLFQPVSEQEDTNYTVLYNFLVSADDSQWATFKEMTSSTKATTVQPKEYDVATVITTLIEADKIKCVKEVSDDFPKIGWYWKGVTGGADENKWLKTAFTQVKEGSQDDRVDLAEILTNNTDLFGKLKNRL